MLIHIKNDLNNFCDYINSARRDKTATFPPFAG